MLDEAKDEFDAILDYVHNKHGIRTERKVYDDILQRILQLDTMPELGTWTQTSNIKAILSASRTRSILASFTPSATPRL